MASIGDLVAVLVADSSQFRAGLSSAKIDLANFAKSAATSLAGIAATFATLETAKVAIGAAESDIKATQKFESVLRSTGGAAGVTSDEINNLAGDLQRLTKFEDDATVNAAALLATFKNIKGDQFKEVLKLAQDLAAVKDIGLDEAVTTLGKAMVEPTEGLNRLKRAGVFLSESQEDLIKHLDATAGSAAAQAEMIKALQATYGGAAESTVTATEKIGLAVGNLTEQIGKKLLPSVQLFADQAVPLLFDVGDALGETGEHTDSLSDRMKTLGVNIMLPVTSGLTFLDMINELIDRFKELKNATDGEVIEVQFGGELAPQVEQVFAEGEQLLFDAEDEFRKKMESLKNEQDVLSGDATKNEIARREAIAAGMRPEEADAIKQQLDRNDALKEIAKRNEELKKKADDIRESVRTPEEILKQRLDELTMLRDSGKIDQQTFDRAKKQAEGDTGVNADSLKAGALQQGSQEAVSAIYTAMRGDKDSTQKQINIAQEQKEHLAEAVNLLRDIKTDGGLSLVAGSMV